jgi:hypothetical protein
MHVLHKVSGYFTSCVSHGIPTSIILLFILFITNNYVILAHNMH